MRAAIGVGVVVDAASALLRRVGEARRVRRARRRRRGVARSRAARVVVGAARRRRRGVAGGVGGVRRLVLRVARGLEQRARCARVEASGRSGRIARSCLRVASRPFRPLDGDGAARARRGERLDRGDAVHEERARVAIGTCCSSSWPALIARTTSTDWRGAGRRGPPSPRPPRRDARLDARDRLVVQPAEDALGVVGERPEVLATVHRRRTCQVFAAARPQLQRASGRATDGLERRVLHATVEPPQRRLGGRRRGRGDARRERCARTRRA